MVKIALYLRGTYDQDSDDLEQYLTDILDDHDSKLYVEDVLRDIINATYEVALYFDTDTGKLGLD